MKTALVTGGAGFVGRHLIPKLQREGYEVTSVDPKHRIGMTFQDWVIYQYPYEKTQQYDLVVHLAANIEDVNVRLNGGLRQFSDLQLDYTMAEWVMTHPPKEAFVWPTSCAVDNSDDPYAWVKLTGEKIFNEVHKAGIRTVILRPYSGYGSDQALSYPFPAIISRAIAQECPLTVWGSGKQVRDFVHIDDLTDAFMHGIKVFPSGVPIDIGTGKPTTFIELAYKAMDAVGYDTTVKGLADKPESSPRRVADIRPAMHYGWVAKIKLEEGIRRAVNEAKNR